MSTLSLSKILRSSVFAFAAASLSAVAFAADELAYAGHYTGKLFSAKGEVSEAELSLDNYKCFVISVKKDPGMETGFVKEEGRDLVMMHTDKTPYRVFTINDDGSLTLKSVDGKTVDKTEECCTMTRN